MQQLLIHSLLISPLVRWVAAPQRRWSRKSGIRIAGLILVVLALLQLRRVELNCFDMLDLDSDASSAEISRAYRKQSAIFHPDRADEVNLPHGFDSKNGVFLELQKCQETLTDKRKTDIYKRFGRTDLLVKKDSSLLSILAVFSLIGYLINFVVCTIFTASTETQRSRYWVNAYLLFALSSEMYIKFLGQGELFYFVPYLSRRLIFEQVEILKDIIPSVLSSAILLSQLTHVDELEMVNEVLAAVSQSNKDIANHIVSKRNDAVVDVPLLPAILKLLNPVPMTPKQETVDPQTSTPTEAAPKGNSRMQTVFNYLFYAYIIKLVIDTIRSML